MPDEPWRSGGGHRRRVRVVGQAVIVGAGSGVASFVVLLLVGDASFAARKAFAAGALWFGFGLLGWAGSIIAGNGFEAMRNHLDVGTDWTEAKSRRAMVLVAGFGGGWMVGASLAAALLGT